MGETFDISGYRVFDAGDVGAAHVTAHRMLDQGRLAEGHRQLGRFLEGRSGAGSDFVHLQWHQVVFELAAGEWDAARARFVAHVLPAAARQEAPTDAPAGLWRLMLAAEAPVALPWAEVSAAAVAHLDAPRDRYVVLHDLLALAGAGDVAMLAECLRRMRPSSRADRVVVGVGRGLLAWAQGDFDRAAEAMAPHLRDLALVGGSRAQNELFHDIHRVAAARAEASEAAGVVRLSRASGFE